MGRDVPRIVGSMPTCHVAVVGNKTDSYLLRDRIPRANPWVSVYWSRSPSFIWWRFDPIDNLCRRVHVHVNGEDDLSHNNVVGLLGMFIAAWRFAKHLDVTPQYMFDSNFVRCEQLTYPPYTGLRVAVTPS